MDQQVTQTLIQKELIYVNEELNSIQLSLSKLGIERDSDLKKIRDMEQQREVENAVRTKTKAYWATMGAAAVGTVTFLIQVIEKILQFYSKGP
jgi:hypothetical protein